MGISHDPKSCHQRNPLQSHFWDRGCDPCRSQAPDSPDGEFCRERKFRAIEGKHRHDRGSPRQSTAKSSRLPAEGRSVLQLPNKDEVLPIGRFGLEASRSIQTPGARETNAQLGGTLSSDGGIRQRSIQTGGTQQRCDTPNLEFRQPEDVFPMMHLFVISAKELFRPCSPVKMLSSDNTPASIG